MNSKKIFYTFNFLFITAIAYTAGFALFWRLFKNYNMSMKEIWLIFIPLLITLAGSIAVNIMFLANAKKIKKWHYSLFVFLDFIVVVWLFMLIAV